MVFGRIPSLPVDLVIGHLENEIPENMNEYTHELTTRMSNIHEFARNRLDISTKAMTREYSRKVTVNLYTANDEVWLYNNARTGPGKKLDSPWIGPFTIVKRINDVVYKIEKKNNSGKKFKIVHFNLLKPYVGRKNQS